MEEELGVQRPIEARAPRGLAEPEDLERVLAGCREGRASSFERLFEHYKDYVYSVALYSCRDPEIAADATQEVFLKLIDRIGQFQARSRFRTWLYRVVFNTVRDLERRRPREAPLEEVSEGRVLEAAGSFERVLRRDTSGRLAAAVGRLSDRLRPPIVLRHVGGLGYQEIAEVLDIPPGTVASRLKRAHEQLAELIPRDSVEIP